MATEFDNWAESYGLKNNFYSHEKCWNDATKLAETKLKSDNKQMDAIFELVNEYVITNQIGATETVVLKQFTSWVQKQHHLSTVA